MLNLKVIGVGAAGNKAAVTLIKEGFNPKDVTLINSTSKDIPEKFKDNAIIFGQKSNSLGGCGKERSIGKDLILHDMRAGNINIDNIIDPTTNAVIIVSSTEGGTGSASAPILAKYIREVLNVPVILCLFFGFNSDVRGMQNSIDLCKELSEDFGVIGISNWKFLESFKNNRIWAEAAANGLFVEIVEILSGRNIKPGDQNIDDTDLYKLVTTPGYMNIGRADLSKIKNIDQFNKAIDKAIDESKLMEVSTKGSKRIGVVFDISNSIAECIDYSAEVLSKEFGLPFEMYTHVQQSNNDASVTWIASGMPMPLDEIQNIYKGYIQELNTINKEKDSFFGDISNMKTSTTDQFNMIGTKNKPKSKDSFFNDFDIEPKKKPVIKTNKSEY